MKKVLSGLTAVACLAIFSIISCHKEKEYSPAAPASSPAVKTERSVPLGEFTPYRVESANNDVTVGFLQSARLFKLTPGKEKDKEYLDLLTSALEKDLPVSVSIYEGTNDISEVHQASVAAAQEYKAAKKSSQATTNANARFPVIPNELILNSLFQACAIPSIPFKYATDGCYARAHKMRQIIMANGYDCYKFFAYGDLEANTGSCCVYWGYHVAPVVKFRDYAGKIRLKVIDPSLFTGPVDQNTWLAKCKDTYCGQGANVSSTSLQPGNVYVRSVNGTLIFDDDYTKTNCTLSAYSGLTGCGPSGNNSSCW
jgi:hypothetical protein